MRDRGLWPSAPAPTNVPPELFGLRHGRLHAPTGQLVTRRDACTRTHAQASLRSQSEPYKEKARASALRAPKERRA